MTRRTNNISLKTYFIADAHLGCLAFDNGAEREKKLVQWLDAIQPTCEALYLLGDMIDFWYEYKWVVPRGYVRFFGKIAEMTDSGIPVYWFTGNHDIWLFNYVQQELGITVFTQPIEIELYGKKLFLAHGDGLGDPSFRFRLLRSIFHSKTCQRLFSLLHPHLAMTIGMQWAKHSRIKRGLGPEQSKGENQEILVQFAQRHAAQAGPDAPDYYIFGHRHIMLDTLIPSNCRVFILGEWLYLFSYGEMDETGFHLKRFDPPTDPA
jgi:UDP-2,3-diacylglucosamine hydrolase